MVKFKPIGDYILTEKVNYHKVSSLIQLPETTLTNKDLKVVAVSDNVLSKCDIKVGDMVLVGKLAGVTVKLDGEEYLMIKETDVIGVYDEYIQNN